MRIRRRHLLVVSTSLLTLMLSACSNGTATTETPPPGTTTDVTATAAVTEVSGPPSVERILEHIEMLAGEIGPRPGASDAEREAAAYIAEVLTAAGYDVATEPFTFSGNFDDSNVVTADESEVDAFMLEGSFAGEAEGRPVFGGMGRVEELAGLPIEGKVLVLDRGMIPFAEKVTNAIEAGAIAVVIVNNEPGLYQGTLGELQSPIPVVGVEQGARELLVPGAADGGVTVVASAGRRERESQNVVGRTKAPCRAYLGAHYDSVSVSPGANDNASGVGLILELARARYTEGLCVIAFGSEESGLWGSQAFVEAEGREGLEDVAFLLNFDMIGKVTDALVIGDTLLTNDILEILERSPRGTTLSAGTFPPFASSDHVSFSAAGVPAVTVYAGDDEFIHHPQDNLENVDEDSIEGMMLATDRALLGLLAAEGMR